MPIGRGFPPPTEEKVTRQSPSLLSLPSRIPELLPVFSVVRSETAAFSAKCCRTPELLPVFSVVRPEKAGEESPCGSLSAACYEWLAGKHANRAACHYEAPIFVRNRLCHYSLSVYGASHFATPRLCVWKMSYMRISQHSAFSKSVQINFSFFYVFIQQIFSKAGIGFAAMSTI